MSTYTVSARKYRPTDFTSVVGQQHITQTLRHAIRQQHIPHAMLFCGPRGIGKTTCARIMAKAINCEQLREDGEPCNRCVSCDAFNRGASYNFYELDAASHNSVEDIRHLTEQVRVPPQSGRYKTYIIDEVHMLSSQAFNAFLKTLEEPPSYAVFILATTEKQKILPTILSRCQIFDFSRITVSDMVAHLEHISHQEGVQADSEALHVVAEKADGALRDALSMYDRISAYAGQQVMTYQHAVDTLNILDYDYYFRAVDHMRQGDSGSLLLLFDEVLRAGFDGHAFINGLADHYRQLFVCLEPKTLPLLVMPEARKARYQDQAHVLDRSRIVSALSILNQCDVQYKEARDQRLHVELSLLRLCHLEDMFKPKPPEQVTHDGHAATASSTREPAKQTLAKKKKDDDAVHETTEDRAAASTAHVAETEMREQAEKPSSADLGDTQHDDPLPPPEPPRLPDNLPVIEVGYDTRAEAGDTPKPRGGFRSIDKLKEEVQARKNARATSHDDAAQAASKQESDKIPAWINDPESIQAAVKSVAQTLRNENRLSLSEALIAFPPEVSEEQSLVLLFDSKPMIRQFEEQRARIMELLCEQLQVRSLRIEAQYRHPGPEDQKKMMIFSDQQRYKYLRDMNPEVDRLREQLRLRFK